jgi:hypothetical protein
MTLDDLYPRLIAEGYGHLIYERGPWGLAIGDFRIVRLGERELVQLMQRVERSALGLRVDAGRV